MSLKLRKLSYPLGAEAIGVDISKPLDDQSLREIQRAFVDHCVLLFRGQSLTSAQFAAFSHQFGHPDVLRKSRDPQYPEITRILNQPKPEGESVDAHYAGSDWHSDASFRLSPTSITMLRAVEVPEVGGDTQFANLYLAYETLSDGMKKLIGGMEGVHIQEEKLLNHASPEHLLESRRAKTAAHPLVRMHPQSGRKSLYVGDKVQMFAGMTPEESRPLLDFLRNHACRPQFVYGHRWQKHDLVMWDNRCTNHHAMGNYDRRTQVRHMEKISFVGEPSGYRYNDVTQTRNLARSFDYA